MPAEGVMHSSPHLWIMAKKIAIIGSPKSSWNNMIGPNVFAKVGLAIEWFISEWEPMGRHQSKTKKNKNCMHLVCFIKLGLDEPEPSKQPHPYRCPRVGLKPWVQVAKLMMLRHTLGFIPSIYCQNPIT